MMPNSTEMLPADYARHRGVSRAAVTKGMQAGKIPYRMRAGKKIIDAAAADLALGESIERIDVEDDDAPLAPANSPAPVMPSNLNKAKTATEVYKAQLARLEYEMRSGLSVKTADVEAAALKCNATVREVVHQVRQWADRLTAAAVREGIEAVRLELRNLERDMLARLGEAFAVLAAAPVNPAPPGAPENEEQAA